MVDAVNFGSVSGVVVMGRMRVGLVGALCLIGAVAMSAQASEDGAAGSVSLRVEVSGFEEGGEVGCGVYGGPAGFPTEAAAALQTQWQPARGERVVCEFAGLTPGVYAVTASHDTNGNRRVDTNFLGMPTEAWGVSGGVRPRFRAPRFEEARLTTPVEQLEVNAASVLQLVHGCGRRFRAQGDGALVLFSSIVAFQGVPGSTTYAATKAFVQSLAEGLAGELAGTGVSVLSVAPGPVATGFGARAGLGMDGAADPQALVAPTLRALGHSGTCRPDARSKLLGYALATLPRPLRVRLMQRIMAGMIEAGARAKGAA